MAATILEVPMRIWLALSLCFWGMNLPISSAEDLLADRGKAAGCIIIAQDAPEGPLLEAAKELASYLQQMSGAQIPVLRESQPHEGFQILVGPTTIHRPDNAAVSAERVGIDGFVIDSIPNGVMIAGRTPQGSANGIYHFAEEVLGVHWYSVEDDGPTFPSRPTIRIPTLKLTVKPNAALRGQYFSFQQSQEFRGASHLGKKLGANVERWWKFNRLWCFPAEVGHAFDNMIPTKLYETHPEYFPYIDYSFEKDNRTRTIGPTADGSLPSWPHKVGRHVAPGSVQRCLSNPAVQRLVGEWTAAKFDSDPDLLFASLSANDGPWWCACEECKKMGQTQSERNLAFCNAVAKLNEKKYPDKGYVFYAYWDTVEPPAEMVAHPNVVPMIATLWQCRVHPFSSDCPDSVYHRKVVDGWHKVAGRIAWRPYTAAGPFTFPSITFVAQELRYYRDHGSIGGMREYQFPPRVNWALLAWAETKLLWDADQDPDKLRRQFIEGYYGSAAADAMEQVYRFIEDGVPAQQRHWGEEDGSGLHSIQPEVLFKPVIDQCKDRLDAALVAVKDQPEVFRHRVERDIATLRGEAKTEYTQ